MLACVLINDNIYHLVWVMCDSAPDFVSFEEELYKYWKPHPTADIAFFTLDYDEI